MSLSTQYRKQWTKYHGIEIPEGWEIHHVHPQSKGGTHNLNNLLACPLKAHNRFHADAYVAWMREGRKFCGTGKTLLKGEARTMKQKEAALNTRKGNHRTEAEKRGDKVTASKITLYTEKVLWKHKSGIEMAAMPKQMRRLYNDRNFTAVYLGNRKSTQGWSLKNAN